eukprot:RCo014886
MSGTSSSSAPPSLREVAMGDVGFCELERDSWRLCRVVEVKKGAPPPAGAKGSSGGEAGKPQLMVTALPVSEKDKDKASGAEVPVSQLKVLSPAEVTAVGKLYDDLFKMQSLDEWTILHQIRLRYWAGKFFTAIGPILVSVNPYADDIALYSPETKQSYLAGQNTQPHLWEMARRVFLRLKRDAQNQCILVSGESGAGKTYGIRVVTDFLAEFSTHVAPSEEAAEARRVARMQPKVGLILEAFGNAKTRRNKDSSRFAKFAKLQFNEKGYLCGCLTECHLLEASRVVLHEANERTFHVFYMVFASSEEQYKLTRCEPWLFQGIPRAKWEASEDGRASALKQHQAVTEAFAALRVDPEVLPALYNAVAGLMHLLCVRFTSGEAAAAG